MVALREIVDQAVAATAGDPDGGLHADELYGLLDVGRFHDGNPGRNDHLANPLNRDPNVYYFRSRSERLRGDEPVNGQFLTLEYCGHDPFALLIDHDDRDALATSILSDAGIVNMFSTYVVAFVDFRVAPYRVTFRDRSGARTVFDKQQQNDGVYRERERFPDRQIEWLGT